MRIEGVIFDVGGVLANDVSEYLFDINGGTITKHFALNPATAKQVGEDLWNSYAYTSAKATDWQEEEKKYWEEFKAKTGVVAPYEVFVEITKRTVKAVPKMRELLAWLKSEKLDLMICSNNTDFFFNRQNEVSGFGPFFDDDKIALSNHFGAPKRHPEAAMFKHLEDKLQAPPENYLFIDDRGPNIQFALERGFNGLYFPAESNYGHQYVKRIIETANR